MGAELVDCGRKIWGVPVDARVGMLVFSDQWSGWSGRLLPGDTFSPLRMTLGRLGERETRAVRIEVTGRTLQWKHDRRVVRCRVVFLGDCEPDVETGGWLAV